MDTKDILVISGSVSNVAGYIRGIRQWEIAEVIRVEILIAFIVLFVGKGFMIGWEMFLQITRFLIIRPENPLQCIKERVERNI